MTWAASDLTTHIWALGILQDMDLAGFHIPKGSVIVTGQYSYHNNPEYWPDAATFSPERFLGKSVADMPEWAAFGDGGRSCIGVKFAMEEAKVGRPAPRVAHPHTEAELAAHVILSRI